MLRTIALVSLLVYAVCAVHWEVREVDSTEDEFEELAKEVMAEGPLLCLMCQKVLNMVKQALPPDSKPEDIKMKLNSYCEKFGFFKRNCKSFVQKHLHTLVDELMTNDGPKTICIKAKACNSETTTKEFTVASDQAYNNF